MSNGSRVGGEVPNGGCEFHVARSGVVNHNLGDGFVRRDGQGAVEVFSNVCGFGVVGGARGGGIICFGGGDGHTVLGGRCSIAYTCFTALSLIDFGRKGDGLASCLSVGPLCRGQESEQREGCQ